MHFWIKVLKDKSLTHISWLISTSLSIWSTKQHQSDSYDSVTALSFSFSVHQQWTELDLECFTYLLASKLLPVFLNTYMIHKRDKFMCSPLIPDSIDSYSSFCAWGCLSVFHQLRVVLLSFFFVLCVASPLMLCLIDVWCMHGILWEGQSCDWRKFLSSKYSFGFRWLSGIGLPHKKPSVVFSSFI